MKKRAFYILLALLLVMALVPVSSVQAEDPFVFSGKGYGHAIGMSQYGARGFANRGWGYEAILKHYYTGISLSSTATGGKNIRVLLADGQSSTGVSSQNAYKVVDEASGATIWANAGDSFTLVRRGDGRYAITWLTGGRTIDAGAYLGPIRFDPTNPADFGTYMSSLFSFGGKRYRGSIRAKANGSTLQVINQIDFEIYLRGIAEMPSSWPMEALKAQAVAARTYAYPKINSSGDFDIYADTRSQVYNGYEKEAEPTWGVNWVNAVTGTFSIVATYNGSPIATYYFSSSGGKTENVENVWGGTALAYLRGVDDPYSDSPYDNPGWTYSISRTALESALDVSGIREIQVGETGVSPRAKMMKIIKNDGGVATMTGTDFRSRLGSTNIKSSWFTSISSPASNGEYTPLLNLPPPSGKAKRGDVNGDGRSDVVGFYNYGGSTTSGWAFLSNGSTFVPWMMWISASGGFDPGRSRFLYGDFDGDGKEDVMALYDYGGATTGVWLFKSTGTAFAPTLWWKSGSGNFDLNRTSTLLTGDFNNDGRDEVLAFYNYGGTNTGVFLFAYNGSSFMPYPLWYSPYWDSSKMTPLVADVDGSGKDQVVAFYDYGNLTTVAWLFNVHPNFTAKPVWSSNSWNEAYAKPVPVDLNGDGRDEIVSFYDYGKTAMRIWQFTWNGTQLNHPGVIFSTPYWDLSRTRLVAGDYDGDGKGDIAAFYNYGASTSGLYLFKMGSSGILAYPAWISAPGYWDNSRTILVKNAPEPNYTPSNGGGFFYRISRLVALDAGHGGTDPGAIGNSLIEKSVNLDVMLRVRDLLLAQGYQVVTTRTTDTDVNASFTDLNGNGYYDDYDELMARVNVANNANADIYVSVHHNASDYPGPNGVMALYGPQSSEGQLLASKLTAGTSGTTGFANLGAVPRGDLYQPTHTYMPGVISEGGYLTNSGDALLLMSDAGRQLEAQGIVNGINAYYATR